jgi:hypothetical protein
MASDLVQAFLGQCRLKVDSTTQISLQRYLGRYINLIVASALISRLIPASGPTLTVAGAGLSASTLYYIYAFDSGGTLTLEASTTGHVTDATFGIETKSGDATRALVGMAYVDAASHFVDSTAARHLANWFNRRSLDLTGTFSADRTTVSTSYTELNTEIRINFLTWADEAVEVSISGGAANSANGAATSAAIGIDSTSAPSSEAQCTAGAVNQRQSLSVAMSVILSEGHHFATLLGGVSNGTATWWTATDLVAGTVKTRIFGSVRG